MSHFHQVSNAEAVDSNWIGLYKIGGTAALILTILLLIPIFFIIAGSQTGIVLQNNFLVLIFKLHAGFSGIEEGALGGLNFPDITIIVLVGVMTLALYPALKQVNMAWAIAATSLPFIGLALFLITHEIGRSGILASGLIISLIMLRGNIFGRSTALVGILAHSCFLIADISIAFGYSITLAAIMGIGYVLFLIWFILIGLGFLKLGKSGK